MDDALPVDDHIYLFQRQTVQPHGFDDFQPLVHQGGAIDGDLCTHFPVGVLQGVGLGHCFQLGAGHAEKWAAGAGEDQPPDLFSAAAAHKALKDCGMLGIHGDDLRTVLLRLSHHQLPGADQSLLVGKANALFRPDGGEGGLQTDHANHGGDNAVGFLQRRRFHQTRLTEVYPDRQTFYSFRQRLSGFLRCHDGELRGKLPALLRHPLHVGSGGERRYPDAGQTADNVQALPADGAGGAENTDTLHHRPLLTPPWEAAPTILPWPGRPGSGNRTDPVRRRGRGSDCRNP